MRLPLVLAAATALCACTTARAPADQPPALAGTRWTIASIDGASVKTMRPTEIRFTADRIEGNAGCNSFGGNYTLSEGRLATKQVISTQMACLGPGMEVEAKFFRIIDAMPAVNLQSRDRVTLAGGDHVAVLRRR